MTADELRKLHEAATAAPWDWWTNGEEAVVQEVSPEGGVIMCDANSVVKLPQDQDLALMVALRNAYADGSLIHVDDCPCPHVWLSQMNELRCGDSGACPFGGSARVCNAAFDEAHKEPDNV